MYLYVRRTRNEICTKDLSSEEIVCIMKKLWEQIGSGVPPGLQNRRKRLVPALVGSIPTCSRQKSARLGRSFTYRQRPLALCRCLTVRYRARPLQIILKALAAPCFPPSPYTPLRTVEGQGDKSKKVSRKITCRAKRSAPYPRVHREERQRLRPKAAHVVPPRPPRRRKGKVCRPCARPGDRVRHCRRTRAWHSPLRAPSGDCPQAGRSARSLPCDPAVSVLRSRKCAEKRVAKY